MAAGTVSTKLIDIHSVTATACAAGSMGNKHT
jgi:hypothetical protein